MIHFAHPPAVLRCPRRELKIATATLDRGAESLVLEPNRNSLEVSEMNVVRYEPWVLMNRLSRDLARLFTSGVENGAFTADDAARSALVDWFPAVDIKEEDKQFVLHADVPGVDPKDIEITMEKGVLTIRGRRETTVRDEKNGARYSRGRIERVTGEFFRRFSLPDAADSQGIKAKVVNGVLEVVIPKQEAVLPRRIEVATR